MCGICGFSWADRHLMEKMLRRLRHRGPDSRGAFFDKASIGNARLSIVDMSRSGSQPMANEDGDIAITYNGEIYNHVILRRELEKKGHRFRSGTDTEVIVHGYEEYGTGILERLSGIFAFCIYDLRDGSLVLARDSPGVKPLYYTICKSGLAFASEIKAILEHGEVKPEVDVSSLREYLSYRYVPGPGTMFRGIRKLLPGTCMRYVIGSGSARISRFCDLKITRGSASGESPSGLCAMFRAAVGSQLMGDAKMGLFLSGGLDSTSVLAAAHALYPESIRTYTMGYENRRGYGDELAAARAMSEHYGTDHKEIIVSADSLRIMPKLAFHLDEPVSDATVIPTYLLSEEAGKDVKFVLTGEGADELFMGYAHYRMMEGIRAAKSMGRPADLLSSMVRRSSPGFLSGFTGYPSGIGEEGRERLASALDKHTSYEDSYYKVISTFDDSERALLLKKRFDGKIKRPGLGHDIEDGKAHLSDIQDRELHSWLPDFILTRLDKMTMAASVEGRVPFLDRDFAGHVLSLPESQRRGKRLLREAMKPYVPGFVLRRRKYPFTLPIDAWYDEGYREYAESVLDDSEASEYFNPGAVSGLLEKGRSNIFHSRQLWSVMGFAIWHKIYIEGTPYGRIRI